MSIITELDRSAPETRRFWKMFEGQVLDAQFPLDQYLSCTDTGATFMTRAPGEEKPVLLKVVRYASTVGARLHASWTLAKQLHNVHLVRVYACGLANLDGLRVAYAVTEAPDVALADVVAGRCLTEEEGKQLFASCAAALDYLHGKQIVHARVEPASVVSVDENIKLAVDHVTKAGEAVPTPPSPYAAPELATQLYSAAADIWSLGTMMSRVLSGKNAAAPLQTEYSAMIERCLVRRPENRCTAEQIVAALPDAVAEESDSPHSTFGTRAKFAIPVVCVLLLMGLWLASSGAHQAASPSGPSPRPVPVAKSSVPSQQEPSQERDRAVPSQIPAPVTTARPAPSAKSLLPSLQPHDRSTPAKPSAFPTWGVVVYTYVNQEAANRRATEINAKNPKFTAHVVPGRNGRSYLVVLGGSLDRAAAEKLRSQAAAAKLPPDSYLMNF